MGIYKTRLPKVYLIVIEDIYEVTSVRVKRLSGKTEDFTIIIIVHQGLAVSLYLLSIVIIVKYQRTYMMRYNSEYCLSMI